MESNRRSFLKHTASLMGMTILSPSLNGLANVSRNINDLIDTSNLTIYQSNDLNLSIHPSIYNKIRSELSQQTSKGLTVDAGNLFNLDKINLEMLHSINSVGYHAVALSPNYLKADIQTFLKLAKSFNFPFVNCNYSSNEAGWSESIKQYVIFNTKNLKIGITSVAQNYVNSKIIVENPYKAANSIAKKLKSENKCDLVICLSQLGMDKTKMNSKDLAIESKNIDFVLSTSEGQKLNYPLILRNKNDHEVILMQGGSGGELICKSVIGYDNNKYRNQFHQEFIMPTKSFASKTDIHKTVKNLQNV